MKPARATILLPVALLLALHGRAQAIQIDEDVTSPDGAVWVNVTRDGNNLVYSVKRKDAPVIEPTVLDFTVDGVRLTTGAAFGTVERYTINETYARRGPHSKAANHCKGARIPLQAPGGALFTLDVRAFNDGAAFRWTLIGDPEKSRTPDEQTTFVLPAGATVWYHDLGGHYEAAYARKDVAAVKGGEWAAPPMTFKLAANVGYACLTEAALRNYAGMAFQADGKCGFAMALGHRQPPNHPFTLRYGEDEHQRLSTPAAITGTITTPWRVVMVGPDLNTLVNSDILQSLCPPPDPAYFPDGLATDWVKPGRAVWKYLDGGQNTLDEMKSFSRWAGELGFEYNVIEGFWRRWSDDELRGLVQFAKERGVGTFLWRHTKELRTPEARAAFFKQCRDAGVAGVKLDFFDHEAKEVVDLYEAMLRDAAAHKLLVNFHGANKPSGLERTWPNELTREAVRGMESGRLQRRAAHDATLPFTRLLAGHADYTPVHFGPRRGDTTAAHQLATAAVFDSALLTYGAYPTQLLGHPAAELIRSVPATWDQTIVLGGSEIGEVAAYARRTGDTWFVAVVNGPNARAMEVTLRFLDDGPYRALSARDSTEDPAAVVMETATGKATDVLKLNLSAGGGYLGRFTPGRAK